MSNVETQRARFAADPGDDRCFAVLEESLYLAGSWEELIALYATRLRAPRVAASPRMRAELHFRLGQVWEERIGQIERAEDCYRNTLRSDPSYRPALQRLRALHCARSQWEVALQLAELEVALPQRPDERADLLAEMGLLWLDRLGDPQQALQHFKQSLTESDRCTRALTGTWRAFEQTGQLRKAERALDHLASHLRGSERAAVRVEQARLLAGPLEQAARALELYRRALGDDPLHPIALEAVAGDARARGLWEQLADLAERRFEAAAADPARQLAVAREAAEIQLERLANEAAAQLWLRRVVALEPGDARSHEQLAELARRFGRSDERLLHLREAVALRGAEAGADALLEVASQLRAQGDLEAALPLLEHALAQRPDEPELLEQISLCLRSLSRFDALADVLERRAGLAAGAPETQAALLDELAELRQSRLGDAEGALQAWQRAFAVCPTRPGVADRIEELLQKRGDPGALRRFCEEAAERGPAPDRARFLAALGQLLAGETDQAEQAQRRFESALSLAPDLASAHAGLQRLALHRGDTDALIRAYAREASATNERGRLRFLAKELAGLHEGRGEREAALDWIQRWIAAEPEEAEALHEAARLQEELGQSDALLETLARLDPLLQGVEQAVNRRRQARTRLGAGREGEAVERFEAALRSYPRDIESLRALVALHERASRSDELARARERLAELLPPPERAACLVALAELYAGPLGDAASALEVWRRLEGLEHAPPDLAPRVADLLERSGRHEELQLQLARWAESLPPDDAQHAAIGLRRAALLLEPLGRAADAAADCEKLLARWPQLPGALALEERALRALGDPVRLADCLGRRARRDADPTRAAQSLRERAQLLEVQAGDGAAALGAWSELLQGQAPLELRREASGRIADLLERDARWGELRAHLESALERGEAGDAVAVHARCAALCRRPPRDPQAAIAHLETAVALAPERGALWAQLSELYAEAKRDADLVRSLEGEIAAEPDAEHEVTLRCRAADLCASALLDSARACRHAERALALAPGHPWASEFLLQHWERSGEPTAVLGLLEERLRRLVRGARRDGSTPASASAGARAQCLSLRLRIAGLRASALADLDGAIAVLEPALDESEVAAAVAEPLADLYQRAGYGENLIELCRRAADAATHPAERAAWHLRLADALRQRHQEQDAAEAYERVLSERPGDLEAQAALRDLYRRLGRPQRLVALLEQQIARLSGPEEVPARLEFAALCELERPVDALAELRRVLELEPGCREAFDRALALAERLARPGVVLELIDRMLLREPPDRGALLVRRARLLAGRGSDDAIATYRAAAALRPTDRGLLRELRELLIAHQDGETALDCLRREASLAPAAERLALLETGCELAARLVSPDASLVWLERLRRERPQDPELLRRMAALHRAAGRSEALQSCLESEAALPCDEPRRCAIARERASLLEEAGSPSRAAAVLEACRSGGSSDADLCRSLERLYARLGRSREQVEALEALLAIAPASEHGELAQRAAALCEDALRDPARAARLWQIAVDRTGAGSSQRADLLRRMGLALRQAGPAQAWARCAEAELGELDPTAPVFADRRAELHAELARSYETELMRPDLALAHLRVLADGAGAAAAAGAARLDDAERSLLRLLRARDAASELAERLAAHLVRRPREPEAWLELARLREERLCDLPGALAAYRRVLELESDCLPALRGLRSCAERLGDFEQVAASLARELEHPRTSGALQRGALLRRLGDLHWRQLSSTTRASRCYAAALEANPRDFDALRSLEGLLEAMEDWRGAAELYESEIEMLGEADPERRREICLRVASLARDQLADPERALRALQRASELAPLPTARQLELAQLHRRMGETAAYADAFRRFCLAPDSAASAADWTQLAEVFLALGRADDAGGSAERAIQLDPGQAPAYELLARLREAGGDAAGAQSALETAALRASDSDAAGYLLRASALAADPGQALALLRAGARRDPAHLALAAALAARAASLGEHELARDAAERALQLSAPGACADTPGARAARLEAALAGGRAALASQALEPAARFFSVALSVDADHPEALAGYGETLGALGDLSGARFALEPLLARAEAYPERARHRALVAKSLVAAGDSAAAAQQLAAALREDPGLDSAHAELVEIHSARGDLASGVAALVQWADCARTPSERGARLLRAARWELERRSALESEESARDERAGSGAGSESEALARDAERHLRDVLEAAPDCAEAWKTLAELLWQRGEVDAAFDLASRAVASLEDPLSRGALALVQARALEHKNLRLEAADAYGIAASCDPGCGEAALARARILRGLGEWRAAADALQQFANRHPGARPELLAEIQQQLARLLAGPLEDVDAAVATYRRAIRLMPQREELRVALAELLSHRPAESAEALEQLRALLAQDPTQAPLLRMGLRIARRSGKPASVADGHRILAALGLATADELESLERSRTRSGFAGAGRLEPPLWEQVRSMTDQFRVEIAQALAGSGSPPHASGAARSSFRAAVAAAEAQLSAPALLPLADPRVGELLSLVAALSLDPDQVRGDGQLVNAVSSALGRRARRRIRSLLEGVRAADIARIDFAAWRRELRALATARALDAGHGSLREALVHAVCEAGERDPASFAAGDEICALVAACAEARALLRRAVSSWIEGIQP